MPDEVRTLSWTVGAAAAYFERCGVDSPRATAEHLAARLLGVRRGDLAARGEEALRPKVLEAMRRGMRRVASGEPLQYVIGQWDFRDFTLRTDRRALVPRPETEQLAGLAVGSPRLRSLERPILVDWGTGSGCLALCLAREFPSARVLALDISEDALALARENASALGLSDRIAFLNVAETDVSEVLDGASVHAIVSNPPYIPSAQVDRLERKVLEHEPRVALDGGPDGMDVLRAVCEEATMLLAPEGEIYLELDAESGQARAMSAHLAELGFEEVRTHRDFTGAERFVSAMMPSGI